MPGKHKDIVTRQDLYDTNQISKITGFSYGIIRKEMISGKLKFKKIRDARFSTLEQIKEWTNNF
tara:strand:+ start:232 stop:423 length:192 start_codon:yes stop_codon:yes gene_type:complete